MEESQTTLPIANAVNQQELKSYNFSKLSQKRNNRIPDTLIPLIPPAHKEPKETSCWNKIKSELAFDHFFSYKKATLGRLIGEWYFSENAGKVIEAAPTFEGKFILALARAGLLDGAEIDLNNEEALRLLGEVSDLDQKNSAPLLYAAIIESRRGNQARAEELLNQARGSEFFDSYITNISKSIFSQVRTPSDLLAVYEVWSTLAVPNYIVLKNLLKGPDTKFFSYQLMSKGIDDKSAINEIEWLPIEYAVGKSLLDSVEPQNKLPTYREIVNRKNKLSEVNVERIFSQLNSSCDISSLVPMVHQLQSHLIHYR